MVYKENISSSSLSNPIGLLPEAFDNIKNLLGLDNSKKEQEKEVILSAAQEGENLKNEIEQDRQQLIVVLEKYFTELLSQQELDAMKGIFGQGTLHQQLRQMLQEGEYIYQQKLLGNLGPEQARQKAFEVFDPSTNIQHLASQIQDYYFANQATGLEELTKYFEQKISDQSYLQEQKKSYSSHTTSTRKNTTKDPALLQYYREEQRKIDKGIAYDVNEEKDPLMKTPQAILKRFVSSGYSINPKTKVTQCARTTRVDAQRLFHLSLPQGNAFDVMRGEEGNFKASIISNLYNKKEKAKKRINSVHENSYLGKSDYVNRLAPSQSNVADLYVTSSTKNGKKYGHRALMFRVKGQRYVLDPYTAVQAGEDKNRPRTLESYALSMKTGRNKREFMRMNFYQAQVNLEVT